MVAVSCLAYAGVVAAQPDRGSGGESSLNAFVINATVKLSCDLITSPTYVQANMSPDYAYDAMCASKPCKIKVKRNDDADTVWIESAGKVIFGFDGGPHGMWPWLGRPATFIEDMDGDGDKDLVFMTFTSGSSGATFGVNVISLKNGLTGQMCYEVGTESGEKITWRMSSGAEMPYNTKDKIVNIYNKLKLDEDYLRNQLTLMPRLNEVSVDDVTKLVWQTCAIGMRYQEGGCSGEPADITLKEADESCSKSRLGGYEDWRLPQFVELTTIPGGKLVYMFADDQIGKYWTSNQIIDEPAIASFKTDLNQLPDSNGLDALPHQEYPAKYRAEVPKHFARCVRGGEASVLFNYHYNRCKLGNGYFWCYYAKFVLSGDDNLRNAHKVELDRAWCYNYGGTKDALCGRYLNGYYLARIGGGGKVDKKQSEGKRKLFHELCEKNDYTACLFEARMELDYDEYQKYIRYRHYNDSYWSDYIATDGVKLSNKEQDIKMSRIVKIYIKACEGEALACIDLATIMSKIGAGKDRQQKAYWLLNKACKLGFTYVCGLTVDYADGLLDTRITLPGRGGFDSGW